MGRMRVGSACIARLRIVGLALEALAAGRDPLERRPPLGRAAQPNQPTVSGCCGALLREPPLHHRHALGELRDDAGRAGAEQGAKAINALEERQPRQHRHALSRLNGDGAPDEFWRQTERRVRYDPVDALPLDVLRDSVEAEEVRHARLAAPCGGPHLLLAVVRDVGGMHGEEVLRERCRHVAAPAGRLPDVLGPKLNISAVQAHEFG